MTIIGRVLFYVSWPLLWLYTPLTRRARVVVVHGTQVLVVKNWFGPGYWQLPGGGVKRGESPPEAARRELSEELGIDAECRELVEGTMIVRQFGLLMRYHFLRAEVPNTDIPRIATELTGAKWIQMSELRGVATEVKTGVKLATQD